MKCTVTKDSVIHNGEIYEVGSVIDLPSKSAESLINIGVVESVDKSECLENETSEDKKLEDCSYQELKKLANDMGLSAKGTKEELIERISSSNTDSEEEAPNTSMDI